MKRLRTVFTAEHAKSSQERKIKEQVFITESAKNYTKKAKVRVGFYRRVRKEFRREKEKMKSIGSVNSTLISFFA